MLIHNVLHAVKRHTRIEDHMITNKNKNIKQPLVEQILEVLDRGFKITVIKMSSKWG